LIVIALPAGAYLLVQWPSVQTFLASHIARQVSANLNAKFEVGKVEIVFFNRVILRDIHIEDQQGDTLLKANRLVATVSNINRRARHIHFNQIRLQDALINLRTDADTISNLRFIIDAFSPNDTLRKNKWDFAINSVILDNSEFTYRRHGFKGREHGVDFSDIGITGLNLLANGIYTTTDTLHFHMRYLNFREKSGFILNHMGSQNSISRSGIIINNLHLATPLSRINLESLNLDFSGFDDFKDFVNRVGMAANFNPSTVNFRDISSFAPGLREVGMEMQLSGLVTGRINNLKGSGLNISALEETSLVADFNMIGLPDIGETFIFLDLHELNSFAGEVSQITRTLAGKRDAGRPVPLDLQALGKINYKGKFTGFIDDFVAYGELRTGLGTLISDLSLVPGTGNMLNFGGRLRAINFNAGKLAGTEQVGIISFNTELLGQISSNGTMSANMEGIVDSVFLFGYNYRHLLLSGNLSDKRFEGAATISDPNIELDFSGRIDLSEEIPVFDFYAGVAGARLHDLQLIREDPDLALSFSSRANFTGNNFDNLNGEIQLTGIVFERDSQKLVIDTTTLKASGNGNGRLLTFSSNLAEARIEGSYEFATLAGSFARFIGHYVPSYRNEDNRHKRTAGNQFVLKVELKEISSFAGFFFPEIYLANGTVIGGTYDPEGYNTAISGSTRLFRYKNYHFTNLAFGTSSSDSAFSITSRAGNLSVGNLFRLENISLGTLIRNDSLSSDVRWDNRDELTYKGDLSLSMSFVGNNTRRFPVVDLDIKPSRIIIADSIWHIDPASIRIDSTSYHVRNFSFGRDNQYIRVQGKLSEHPLDSLHIEFQNIRLQNTELITMPGNFLFAGNVNGHASLSDLRKNPVFQTDLEVAGLHINRQDFGDLRVTTSWENENGSIFMHAWSDRDFDRIINMEGHYMPRGSGLDFDIALSKINLQTFDGYLDGIFENIRGLAGGELRLEGSLGRPVFNGAIYMEKASFIVDYLKARYNFTHDIAIKDNNINFSNLLLYDSRHNTCRANGTLRINNFRDMMLNVYLYPESFMVLNTTLRDNDLFYGQVFASGLVNITGPVNNLTMNISARTNRNTRFFIPLQKSGAIDEFHFLTFRTPSPASTESETSRGQEAGSYLTGFTGVHLNMDVEVTPDAEVQIIFDSKIGDIIRGRGTGSFKMDINTQGQFNMYGEYVIEQGDYLFTLQNVINKKFDIERGGRIYWSGDPFDANVDLKAVYRLRAAPDRLIPSYNGNEERYSRRIPVECQIIMKEKLMTPQISFWIDLPTADPETRQRIQGILNTEEKRNEQFLALLVINSFLPDQDMTAPSARRQMLGSSATDASMTTVSEFFSNQLSNWLSQISRDFDFGINWRPGDYLTHDEVEVAMSTQVFNDRVSINGHVDVGGRQANTSNIVGDFDVDIKLNRSGKLRLKAFTRANDNLVRLDLSPYTQGVGLFYREDFNSIDELLSRYWGRVFPSTGVKGED
jgi:hypothetical protein